MTFSVSSISKKNYFDWSIYKIPWCLEEADACIAYHMCLGSQTLKAYDDDDDDDDYPSEVKIRRIKFVSFVAT